MSEEAESTATQRVIDNFKSANEAKAKLEAKLKALGDSLEKFAAILKYPEMRVFDIRDDCISAKDKRQEYSSSAARLTQSQMDWKDLCETLDGYCRARENKQVAASQLRSMGLPIAE